MSVLWKRLNDQGKNWRHVYKSLTLLDYIIKNGSEKVIHQCREGLFNIQTLKEFLYIDEAGRDQGIHVREKSRQVLALLTDDALLNRERRTARRTRKRMLQTFPASHIAACANQFIPLSIIHAKEELPVANCERADSSKPVITECEQGVPQTQGMTAVEEQIPEGTTKEACVQDLISFFDEKPSSLSEKMKARSESCPPTWNNTLVPPTTRMSSSSSTSLRSPETVEQNMRMLQMTSDDKIIMPTSSVVYRPFFLAPNLASLRVGGFQTDFRPAGPVQCSMPAYGGMYSAITQFSAPVTTSYVTSIGTRIPMMASSLVAPPFYNPLSFSSALSSSKNPFL
uniref:ENTH domain-containing protein 1 n=1 Tax=Geotrypetes seraphini TaxID=260995 RepID=A0A6P8QQ25_GEOSA|nr:ENTH domain-containing protein 1 [Geotrypetes seraphini]